MGAYIIKTILKTIAKSERICYGYLKNTNCTIDRRKRNGIDTELFG